MVFFGVSVGVIVRALGKENCQGAADEAGIILQTPEEGLKEGLQAPPYALPPPCTAVM